MIHDIENEVYTKVATALRAQFSDINVSGTYVRSPSAFPFATIIMQDTRNEKRFWTENDEYDGLMFEVNVYSNKTNTKKSECKAIANAISDVLTALNFRRTSQNPMPNLEDASIYRIVARYEAITDGNYIYRR